MPLPTVPTAPFCPAEVKGSIAIDAGVSRLTKLRRFAGPGLLVAIGYMDPGNWATDIQAGSQFGYALLWVVVFSSVAAIFLQTLAARLGLVAGRDLAQASYDRYGPFGRIVQWITAEVSIIACDIAEVLGCALAFKLLLGVPLAWGIVLTALDTMIVLGLQGKGFRQVEAIVFGLIGTMAFCFVAQVAMVPPDWRAVLHGLAPGVPGHDRKDAIVLALGIVGATIMPHNLYLHSSVVQTRRVVGGAGDAIKETLAMVRIDTWISLVVAMLVNAAILVLAGAAFHATGQTGVADIEQAYRLITPIVGGAAAWLFGIALLASGQSSTLTGTIAGQVIMDGFLHMKMPCYQRRLITRGLALAPALAGVLWMGDGALGQLLVWSQVLLSLQLPFAMWPLIRSVGDRSIMREYAIGRGTKVVAWTLFVLISITNLVLVTGFVG
ncbi:metal ion transporter, metal ion family protein [Burkholderia pseudomallei MSHR5613]|uniref:Divalent metal cation transporter MntH n=1 Tax=Burkholderia pseudomallei TaxID=28450 RepID=A0AA40J9L7_BURPE|nr:Nramp family divalent metal transporter [Burkholderia pseudomallei]KGD16015.1 metal ion transporter, metal ion family protein [Burkholderia pseudomallei]KGS50475.1 metal ion transporter, metal ion family protein [Burkholderia pseudomallei MSHR5613]KGS96078.1 metal ion transporter, metal ion family protein [Burkholderia pseudomallei MSHR7498]KGW58738.1 metal ion transporter, metal ion family protein [Burkholderia pseudomallei MSHR1029]KGX06586.1 metal ion transporter, metal ion family protei